MVPTNYADLLPQIVEWAKEASEIALQTKGDLGVQLKVDGSLVTHADKRIETFFRERLPQLLPGSTVWGEEEGFRTPGEAGLWALDPIDGTSNFRFGSPHWGISIGLLHENKAVLGVIAMPDLGKIYSGAAGTGAFCNGIPLSPIRPGEIECVELVSYGDVTLSHYGTAALPGKMRYQGAFVADSAMFLEGVYRAMLSDKAALYDAAASICLAIELGADVRYADGEPLDINALLNVRPFPKAVAFLPPNSGFHLARVEA